MEGNSQPDKILLSSMRTRVLGCTSQARGISEGYVSRILRLAMLAPDIVDGISRERPFRA
jgi:hypothetical protein